MALFNSFEVFANWMLAALLVAVILFDLRQMRLPNWLSLSFVALFVIAVAWVLPMSEMIWRVGVAGAVLLIGMAANAARLLGGGDVKVFAALVLFVPTGAVLSFILLFCICLFVGILALLAVRHLLRGGQTGWIGLNVGERYPMGVSIGAAGLIMLALS